MRALITGASSGMGLDFAKKLSREGYDLVLVARNKEKLEKLQRELKTDIMIEVMDLSIESNVFKLYDKYKNEIDLLINNAGYGYCGLFHEDDIKNDLNMIDLNVKCVHILTKLFLKEFVEKDKGEILNVASAASFEPGPLMATYYSTKSYVYNMSMAIYEELRRKKSHVKIHILCPGPVDTNFNKRANVTFSVKSLKSSDVVSYTLACMKKNKLVIIPGFSVKMGIFANRIFSRRFILKVIYNVQKRKLRK